MLRTSEQLKLLCLAVIGTLGLSLAAHAEEEDSSNPIVDTIVNFIEYINETRNAIAEKGGERSFTLPQWQDAPGLGPISVIPEFADVIDIDLPGFMTFIDIPPIPLDRNNEATSPDVPAINRTVVGYTEEGFTEPHIPPLRWTADGRIGVDAEVGGKGGDPDQPYPLKIYLLAPEKLSDNFVDTAPGPQALVLERVNVTHEEVGGYIHMAGICDPYTPDAGQKRNPYACGEDGADDCYDVTLIGSSLPNGNRPPRMAADNKLKGVPMHVRVSNPKTPAARIAEISFGEPKFSKARTDVLFEPIMPADGRLLVARRGFTPLIWQNTQTKKTHLGSYDIVYAVNPPDSEPCDVTGLSDLYPITHAPYDERVNQRYDFAAQPFRDPGGRVIPDGVDIKGTYPWMDKEAKMFSMQVSGGKLFPAYAYADDPLSRYPARCVDEENCGVEYMKDSDSTKDILYMIVGSWTQGKMVMLDGLINDIDYRLSSYDKHHSYISLYEPGTGNDPADSGEVRVGSTRGRLSEPNLVPVRDDENTPLGSYFPNNISVFDSIENRHNHLKNIKPVKAQDVVWNISSGRHTQEFAFDDYLNPDGFIISNMVGHLKHKNSRWYKMNYYDGWNQKEMNFTGQVRIQNGATSLPERWQIPEYGRVYNGRLEPVANGGIEGKGLWFNGNNTRVEYDVPEQPQNVFEKDWYYGLFIDPRHPDDSNERVLIRFPDNSKLTLVGLNTLVLRNHFGARIAIIDVSGWLAEQSWTHIALQVKASNEQGMTEKLALFINGYLYWQSDVDADHTRYRYYYLAAENFRPVAGEIRLGDDIKGRSKQAFRGWMDEFKVFAYEPNLESACNYAHGTLVGLTENVEYKWQQLADQYQTFSHDAVSEELALYGQETLDQYLCYHDYSDDDVAHVANTPEGSVKLRDALHFPEGPLYHDAPRPDSSHNEFCLSCHHDGAAVRGLQLSALSRGTGDAKYDRRRQPLQPPARIYGNIPANWFPGSPQYPMDAGMQGALIDEWVMPSAANASPKIRNLVFADAESEGIKVVGDDTYSSYTLDSDITKLRINADGLISKLDVKVNGETMELSSAPFTFNLDKLKSGSNRVSIQAYLDDGSVADTYQQHVSIYFR